MSEIQRLRILFVCMGNICRSPLAEGIFLHKINVHQVANRFTVDSCGTGGWHIGDPPDHRVREVASENDVALPSRARQIHKDDFQTFDHIICMDNDNLQQLLELGAPRAKLSLLLEYDSQAEMREVPDPYYGGPEGFQLIFRLIDSATEALLESLLGDQL